MRLVKAVTVRSTGRAEAEIVLLKVLGHSCMRGRMIGFQGQQIVQGLRMRFHLPI